jgi:ParB family transcriptional regulator, chromosome partitioning protein
MARKAGLGRGLDALIPGAENNSEVGENFVPIVKIKPNPLQPRTQMNEEELKELSASIHEHGVLQPLIVTHDPSSDGFVLIAGERRLRASQMAGLDMVPVIIREATEQQRLELALIENVQRSNLNALEMAEAYQQLNDEFNLTQDEIADQVGKNRVTVANTLRLLKLTETVKKALIDNKISEGHARALLGLVSPSAQNAALQTILSHDLNVRQTEALVKKFSGLKPEKKDKEVKSADLVEIETQLRDRLGTKVTLNHTSRGGTLVIHYYSDEELETLVSQIMK